jgi:hypothetical protein
MDNMPIVSIGGDIYLFVISFFIVSAFVAFGWIIVRTLER